MNEKQSEFLREVQTRFEEITTLQLEYWHEFTNVSTWQFWVLILMLVLPLLSLLFFMDRRHALLLGFFGLNYHVWFSYTNSVGIKLGLWEYPFHLIPPLPSFSLDAAFVPVLFMFLYQWVLKYNKNLYLYALILSALLAFIFKPIIIHFHFFHMLKWVNYFHLFIFYYVFFIVSIVITNVFLWFKKQAPHSVGD